MLFINAILFVVIFVGIAIFVNILLFFFRFLFFLKSPGRGSDKSKPEDGVKQSSKQEILDVEFRELK